jgi:hypothetical protein
MFMLYAFCLWFILLHIMQQCYGYFFLIPQIFYIINGVKNILGMNLRSTEYFTYICDL